MTAKVTDIAEFGDEEFDYYKIKNWALADDGGGLPEVSAQPFANWINNAWNEFDDESGTQTNEDVLKGALDYWTGGRS
jgi:hypothetical protein